MKAEDLRMGNLVYHKDEVHVVTPATIVYQKSVFKCYPIELTAEWLERSGFKREGGSAWYDKILIEDKDEDYREWLSCSNGIFFHCNYSGQGETLMTTFNIMKKMEIKNPELLNDKLNFIMKENKSLIRKPIQYVHQLQNLYHALTGNELEIK